MKKIIKRTLVLFYVLITGCGLPDIPQQQLPSATQKGANTLGCLINGQMFIADEERGYFGNHYAPAAYFDEDSFLIIEGQDLEMQKSDVRLSVKYKEGQTKFDLEDDHFPVTSCNIYHDTINQFNFFASRYYIDINNVGHLRISTITDQFVAGTFEFTAVNEQGKIITISEGRFDVEFR
jgi:hypothetical protein